HRRGVRLFIALNLPDPLRRELWDAVAPLREKPFPIKWVRPEGIHLTLKFLGEAPPDRVPELEAALDQAAGGMRPVTLALSGFGAFPRISSPRVLWVGLTQEPALELLQHQVERTFEPLGFPTEARPFNPHVTLGRARNDARARDFTGLDGALGGLAFAQTAVVETVD